MGCSKWIEKLHDHSFRKPRLTSTLIQVSINDNVVYQGVLQPRQDILEALTEEAVATTQNYLVNYEEITRQLNGEDLAGSWDLLITSKVLNSRITNI